MIVNPPKQIDLVDLQTKLNAAGITSRGLHAFNDENGLTTNVDTYDANGNLVDLPPAALGIIQSYAYTSAVKNLLTDTTYDLKSRRAFAIILGIQPTNPMFPTI